MITHRKIIFDLELTGNLYQDRIIEIGMVEMMGWEKTGEVFHSYVNPEGKRSNPGAFMIHGIKDDFLKKQKKFSTIVNDVIAFIGDADLYAHGTGRGDLIFLNRELERCGKKPVSHLKFFDTQTIARRAYPDLPRHGMDALIEAFGLTRRGKHHSALQDADLLADIMTRISNNYPILNELSDQIRKTQYYTNIKRKKPVTGRFRGDLVSEYLAERIRAVNAITGRKLTDPETKIVTEVPAGWIAMSEEQILGVMTPYNPFSEQPDAETLPKQFRRRFLQLSALGLRSEHAMTSAANAWVKAYKAGYEAHGKPPFDGLDHSDPDRLANRFQIRALFPDASVKVPAGTRVGDGTYRDTVNGIKKTNSTKSYADFTELFESGDFWSTVGDDELIRFITENSDQFSNPRRALDLTIMKSAAEKSKISRKGEAMRWACRGLDPVLAEKKVENSELHLIGKVKFGVCDEETMAVIRELNENDDPKDTDLWRLPTHPKDDWSKMSAEALLFIIAEHIPVSLTANLEALDRYARREAYAWIGRGLRPDLSYRRVMSANTILQEKAVDEVQAFGQAKTQAIQDLIRAANEGGENDEENLRMLVSPSDAFSGMTEEEMIKAYGDVPEFDKANEISASLAPKYRNQVLRWVCRGLDPDRSLERVYVISRRRGDEISPPLNTVLDVSM